MAGKALITGGSSGIGAAFAAQLADRGCDLILVARGLDALEATATQLRHTYSVEVEVITADLSEPTELAQIEERLLTDPAIDILVNNAGYGTYGSFVDLDINGESGQIDLNVRALVRLTHAAARAMTARSHGSIVNISSTASAQPMPYSAVYAASKAFVTSFSHAIADELSDTGVQVLVVLPGFTHTEFHARDKTLTYGLPSFAWMQPDDVARAALDSLDKGRHVSVPGLLNQVLVATSRVTPPSISRRMSARVSRHFTN